MKFGNVNNPDEIDFALPEDHSGTIKILGSNSCGKGSSIYVGCAKWNRQELKNFYPRGTRDELEYYASHFNAVELNATFYRIFPPEQVSEWRDKVPALFRFFPKVHQKVSHRKWLNDIEQPVEDFTNSVVNFKEKLGTVFLQLRADFAPKHFGRVVSFIETWPKEIPLAMELRHGDWFNDQAVAEELYQLFEENNVANAIVDTAGRRDLLHMRLTNSEAFVRYVGANHSSDYTRLDEWVDRLEKWTNQGLQKIHFFIHQNEERESPDLAAHFIKKLNHELRLQLKIPQTLTAANSKSPAG